MTAAAASTRILNPDSPGHKPLGVRWGGGLVKPNLYIMLIGASGSGKDDVCKAVSKFLYHLPVINGGEMKFTGSHLNDLLSGEECIAQKYLAKDITEPISHNACLYIITEEVAFSFPTKEHLAAAIVTLIKIHNGVDAPLYEGTRTSGVRVLHPELCVNWLGGSTIEYARQVADRENIKTGFWGRIIPVMAWRDPKRRIAFPEAPANKDELEEHILQRCAQMALLGGAVDFTPDARELCKDWYEKQTKCPEDPHDDRWPGFWRRQTAAVKLALIESLQAWDYREGPYDYLIHERHMAVGIERFTSVYAETHKFYASLSLTKDAEITGYLKHHFRRHPVMTPSYLSSLLAKKRWTAKDAGPTLELLMMEGWLKRRNGQEVVKEFPEIKLRGSSTVWVWLDGRTVEREDDDE